MRAQRPPRMGVQSRAWQALPEVPASCHGRRQQEREVGAVRGAPLGHASGGASLLGDGVAAEKPNREVSHMGEQEIASTPRVTFEEAFADEASREKYEKAHERLYLEVIVDSHVCLRDARVILVETPLWLLNPG